MRLKICGITNKKDLQKCIPYVDAVGFIVEYQELPRSIDLETAKELLSMVPPFIEGVIVVPNFNKVKTIINTLKPSIIQLHGNETVEEVKDLRQRIDCKIIKACGLSNAFEFSKFVDAILIDDKYGPYNIKDVQKLMDKIEIPVILAGHITCDNVLALLNKIQPYALDVASGVEERPGKKDILKIKRLRKQIELGGIVGSIIQKKTIPDAHKLFRKLNEQNKIHIITELKPSSPSKGHLKDVSKHFNSLISSMERGGASAISVLVEPIYFNGDIDFIKTIKHHTNLPIIAKGFFFTNKHLNEIAKAGADAFLLMVRVVESNGGDVQSLIDYGASLGMDAMVEVANAEEMQVAIQSGAKIIEINNRAIYDDLEIDFNTIKLGINLPSSLLLISASGIHSAQDIKTVYDLSDQRINAVLIGTSIMQSENPESLIQTFVSMGEKVCI